MIQNKNNIQIYKNERIDILYPSHYEIIQSREVFSYSMDAVLLGHFARVPKSYKSTILDLCAGNGAVTMAISKQTNAPVIGIEIQERLANMAERSSALNHLSDKITYLNMNLLDYQSQFKLGTVDMITCNPPYFKSDKDRQNSNEALALARHEISLTMEDLLMAISQLLKKNGTAYLVYSTERFIELINECDKHQLTPKRVQMVYPKPGKVSKFFLIELIKEGSPLGFKMEESLYIMEADGRYSTEMSAILYERAN